MLKNLHHSPTPGLSYWNCERYPYYIPSIKSIELISAPFQINTPTNTPYEEMHICLKGSASYAITSSKAADTYLHISENDIVFFRGGMQKYAITKYSDDYKILKIQFCLYTCHNQFTQSSAFDFVEALNTPIENKRLDMFLPLKSHYHNGDEMHRHISKILEEYRFKNLGYPIQIQTHFLQLIFDLFRKTEQKFSTILNNIDHIGITSKSSPYAIMKKDTVLTITNVEIYDQNPNSKQHKPKLLSLFDARKNYKLDPNDESLTLETSYDSKRKINSVILTASEDTVYHVWLSPDKSKFTNDLRPYSNTAHMRFFAKCNTEMRFDLVLYNHSIHKYITHTFNITPSSEFSEYCVPIIRNESANKSNPHIHKIINYIENNYEHKIMLEDISAHTHLNISYLSELFKEYMDMSISDYILNYRLSIAKNNLLNLPDTSISEIALSCGFYDTAHFSKAFKKQFGVTAREYRNHGLNNLSDSDNE